MPDENTTTTTANAGNTSVTWNGPVPAVKFQTPPAEPKDSATDSTQDAGGDDDDADLGDAGKKALRAERIKARAETKKRQELEAELAALRAAAAKDTTTEQTVDTKALTEAAKAEARAELLKDRALDKIEVLATKNNFANPELALRLLRSDVDSFISGGAVDTDAIKDALAELLEANPGLAAQAPRRFQGGADQGPRGAKPADLDTQIAAAAAAGNVREQIRLQNLKLLPAMHKMFGG